MAMIKRINKKAVIDGLKDAGEFVNEKRKQGTDIIVEKYGDVKYGIDKKKYSPVFKEDIESDGYSKPFIIRVVDFHKAMEVDACKGAVGLTERAKGEKVLTLYSDYAKESGIAFYPNVEETVFCMDPYKENTYICLDEYFHKIKNAKVDELETIAHQLGAKSVKISLKVQKTRLISNTKNVVANGGEKKGNASLNYECFKDEDATLDVVSEVKFEGSDTPTKPVLTYFKEDENIKSLILMRMDPIASKLQSKTYSLE